MAYSDIQLQKIRVILAELKVTYEEKKMFNGICFMVDDKMCFGSHVDKESGLEIILARMSNADCQEALEFSSNVPMIMRDKVMPNYIYIGAEEAASDDRMRYWIGKCLAYNPMAKKSKK